VVSAIDRTGPVDVSRRTACGLAALSLFGCASEPGSQTATPRATGPLTPWRVVNGGFLAPPQTPGAPPRPGTGMFVKLLSPAAIALRGPDLLVADAGASRLWRLDAAMNLASGIAGAPVLPNTALAIGPDLSAWVLDPASRQVLRFARDGRLLQTYRVPTDLPSPVAFALADGGATLLVADGMGAQWSEQRGASGIVQKVSPQSEGGARISGVDGLAATESALFVLDRLAASVHKVARDGRVLATLGRGELIQPSAIAADRHGRVFVIDQAQLSLVLLREGAPAQRFDARELQMQRIGGIAVDERVLALSDPLLGQVATFLIAT
jgi:hypothetical protein